MPATISLISTDPRDDLVRYLEGVGFGVRSFQTPFGAPREGTLVWLTEFGSEERMVIDTVRWWFGARPRLRAIVVTSRPVRMREATEDTRGRVQLLPAPVIGWQLVDALRDESFSSNHEQQACANEPRRAPRRTRDGRRNPSRLR